MRLTFLLLWVCMSCQAQDQRNVYSTHAWEERDEWQKPHELIRLLDIDERSHVADIGCHEGYMTFKLAEVVTHGRVYAVDVDQWKLDKVKLLMDERNLRNIQVTKGDYDNPHLENISLDAVLILDTYHEMDDHDKILQHVKTALKPGGRLVVCEPLADERRELPREAQENRHELGMEYAVSDLEKAGFRITFKKDPFIDRTKVKGDKMWVVIAIKD